MSALPALFLMFSTSAVPLLGAEALALPEGFPLWQKSLGLRMGVGYKDNVALSSFAPQGSGFEIASAEATLFRLPWNNWQFTFLASGSDARYFNRDTGIDTEQNAAASAELAWFLGRGWKSSSTLQYIYLNQVMDVSATYGTPLRQEVLGHGLTAREGLRKDFGVNWAELTFMGSRYFFQRPLDDYWQLGPRLAVGRYYGQGSEVSLSYQVAPLLYDTREQVDLTGAPIPGSALRFVPQTVELAWEHYWDTQRRWRSSTRLNFELSEDNGSGYFDYRQYRLVEQLRYRRSGWELSAQGALAYYDFPNQAISPADLRPRHRTAALVTVRAEKRLSKHWKVYAAYDYERSLSNLKVEQYQANTGSAGVEWGF